MKTKILLSVMLFAEIALAIGNEGGGGLPSTPDMPEENFSYSCTARVAEQITEEYQKAKSKTCVVSAIAPFKVTRKDFQQYTGMYSASVDTKEFQWKTDYAWEGCHQIPKNAGNNHMISLSFGEDEKHEKTLRLHIRVLKEEGGEYLWAGGQREESFSLGKIETSAEFYQKGKIQVLPSRDLLLSLQVKCVRL